MRMTVTMFVCVGDQGLQVDPAGGTTAGPGHHLAQYLASLGPSCQGQQDNACCGNMAFS